MEQTTATGKRLRWGIMGCARIARLQVVPAILRCDNAALAAVASRSPARLDEFQSLFGPFRRHEDYAALIEDPGVDALYIPLPNTLHYEWTLRALRAGKHVLCEKPLALSGRDAETMIRTAEEHGVVLMEAFMYRYTDRMHKIRQVLESGVLGEIRSIHSTFRFLLDRENTIKENPDLGGGSLFDVGCYPLNLIGLITQDEPCSIGVECFAPHGVDINLSAVLRYQSGLIASLHCGFNAFGRMHSEITGSRGILQAPDTFLNDPGHLTVQTASGTEVLPVVESDRYAEEIRDFSAAVLEQRKPLLPLAESLRNARVLERIAALRAPGGST